MSVRRNILGTFIVAASFAALSTSSISQAQDGATRPWPMFRGNALRTGTVDDTAGPAAPVDAIWAIKDTEVDVGDVSPSPAVVGDRLYIGGSFTSVFFRGGNIYCLDIKKGEILWRFNTGQQLFSSPAVVDGRVYCGEGLHSDGNSSLHCLDATSGTEIWSFPTKSHLESSPAVLDGRVYFGAGDDGVYCVTADKGEEVWHYEGVHVDVAPAVGPERVYFGTGYGVTGVYALNRKTGKKVWSIETPNGAWGTPTIDGDDLFYAIGNGNFYESSEKPFGRVICCDAATGEERWHYDVGDGVLSAIAVVGNRLYFGCRDRNVYCLDRRKGAFVWKHETGGPVVSSPAVSAGTLYIGSDDGSLYALNAATGEVDWTYDIRKVAGDEARIWGSPALVGGRLYFGSTLSYIFCLGHVKKQPSS